MGYTAMVTCDQHAHGAQCSRSTFVTNTDDRDAALETVKRRGWAVTPLGLTYCPGHAPGAKA